MAASKAGSPITIDGGGSISINFKEDHYPANGDDHDHYTNGVLKTSAITDSAGKTIDLSPLIAGHPELCKIEITFKNPSGKVKIKGKPLGVNFKGSLFKKNPSPPPLFMNANASMTKVEFRYGGGQITFDEATVSKGAVFVNDIEMTPPKRRRRRAKK